MEELFRQYWWLIFPLSWFVFGAYQSWLSYKANRDTLDLIKSYAAAGASRRRSCWPSSASAGTTATRMSR
jgi:hypothetical protein